MIELKPITKENYKEVMKLSVHKEQESHVMAVEKSLATAYVYRDCIHPFAIYLQDKVIGFIMCRYNEEYNNYFLWQFIIDANYQNKGYGRLALFALLGWIAMQGKSKEVVTTVIKGNEAAERLYRDIGFVNTEEHCDEEIDLIYVMGE